MNDEKTPPYMWRGFCLSAFAKRRIDWRVASIFVLLEKEGA